MVARLCAASVGVILALAGAGKITSWKQWRASAARQHVWSWIAFLVPALELILGAALVVLKPVPAVLGLATLLLVVFTSFLAMQVMSKSEVPCACFGANNTKPPAPRDVVRNLGLIALLFVAAALS